LDRSLQEQSLKRMRFQVLSHAGLLVENNGVQVVVDPWLIGSTYWRSWWNYPPPSKEMIAQLKPSFIYLTHIHWDHFQGVSLKGFPYSTPIFAPKGHFGRIKRDLNGLGFQNVTELNHGESVTVGPDLKLTSYTFGLNCDSAVVFEGSGATLLNLNDCKIMGRPLKHLLRRHKRPDFVFCSHSSANSRSCFEIIDDPHVEVDDLKAYIDRFYQFVTACNARYAVPFASNQCYLHKETFRFNADSRTPVMVKEYWERKGIQTPEIQALVSGDSWCTENGFQYAEKDWFTDRPSLLLEYQKQNEEKLSEFYRKEERASGNTKAQPHEESGSSR